MEKIDKHSVLISLGLGYLPFTLHLVDSSTVFLFDLLTIR
jgi:hypothetical protein